MSAKCPFSNSILSQHCIIREVHLLRPNIVLITPDPERSHKEGEPTGNKGIVVHRGDVNRQCEWKAKDDDESGNIETRNSVHGIAQGSRHPKPPRGDVSAPREEVRKDSGKVGEGSKNDKRADKGREGSLRANVDTAEDSTKDGAEEDSVGRVVITAAHLAKEGAEGCGLVTS